MKIKNMITQSKFVILAFFLPMVILTLSLMGMGITPFGDQSMLISDMGAAYVNYLSAYKRIFSGEASIFYTWGQMQGVNMISFISFYIASPFNLILLFFPKESIQEVITLILLLKVASSGATCAYFLKNLFKRNTFEVTMFSCCYALMSYNIVNSFNIMWLDGVIILPLVLWGVEKLLRDSKHYLLFAITLVIAFITEIYISYMIGLFAALYFVYRYIVTRDNLDLRELCEKCIVFLKATLLSLGCSAGVIIPIYIPLMTRGGFFGESDKSSAIRFEFMRLISKLFVGSYDSVTPNGTPCIYCGLIIIVLVLLFFLNKKISYKEKIVSFVVLLLLFLSLCITALYVAWHGFEMPTYFEGRFAFGVCLMMIILAMRSFEQIDGIQNKQLNYIFLFLGFVIITIDRKKYPYLNDTVIIYTIVFVILYFVVFTLINKKEIMNHYIKYIPLALTTLVCVELIISTNALMMGLDHECKFPEKSQYAKAISSLEGVIENIRNKDNDFYRIEKDYAIGDNDAIDIGYPAISAFCTTYNAEVLESLQQMGIDRGHNWIKYVGVTPIGDALFDIKYLLSKDRESFPYYQNKGKQEDIYYFENPYALSLGILMSDEIKNIEKASEDPFKVQNQLMSALSGKKGKDYFQKVEVKEIKLNNAEHRQKEISKEGSMTGEEKEIWEHYYQLDKYKEATVEYVLKTQTDGPTYAFFNGAEESPILISIDGDEAEFNFPFRDNHIIDLGYHKKGDEIKLKISPVNEHFFYKNVMFYSLDMKEFERTVFESKDDTIQIESYTDTRISGKLTVEDKHVLFTSIPYDKGWRIKLNGQVVNPIKVFNSFLGIEIKEKGVYDIELSYTPQGLNIGGGISIISFLAFVILRIFEKQKPSTFHVENNKELEAIWEEKNI